MVDADHGYGNALNAMRTVQELETAGVAALTIEDTDLPQPFGRVGDTRLLPLDEGVGKMRAALAGRQDPSLVVIGRTSAPGVTGIRSEEHTSELQSLMRISYAVFCLKKKTNP